MPNIFPKQSGDGKKQPKVNPGSATCPSEKTLTYRVPGLLWFPPSGGAPLLGRWGCSQTASDMTKGAVVLCPFRRSDGNPSKIFPVGVLKRRPVINTMVLKTEKFNIVVVIYFINNSTVDYFIFMVGLTCRFFFGASL